LTKRQFTHATTNATAAATFSTITTATISNTTSVATTCKAKNIKIEIIQVCKYTGYQKDISAISKQRLIALK
jgi:ribosomal protein S8